MQCSLGRRDASECSPSGNRSAGSRDLLTNVRYYALRIRQRGSGELARSNASLQIGLNGLQVGNHLAGTAESLAALADHVLP